MNDLKAKLNELRKEDWDISALEIFKVWEEHLDRLSLDKNYLELPQSVEIAAELKKKISDINNKLLNDREITEKERDRLFALKDISEMVYSHYSLEDNLKQTSLIEEEINNHSKI